MRRGPRLVLLLVCALPSPGRADTYPRQPAIDVLHYDLQIELSDASDALRGTARIDARVRRDGTSVMALDLEDMQVERLTVGGRRRTFEHRAGRLAFDLDRPYRAGEVARIEVRYRGTARAGMRVGPNRHGRRMFCTENWPDRARHWFPCVDHPSDKATVALHVTAPARYQVVGNGRLAGTRPVGGGRKRTSWIEAVPIPSYSIVLAAAEFSIRRLEPAGVTPLAVWAYPEDAVAAAARFARGARALELYRELIGPFPYEKLAHVETATRLGGMENASAIFYAESGFAAAPPPEAPMAHEIAHQWFGDSVTPADWDHLWLSEGFATYFDHLFYERLEGAEALRTRLAAGAARIRGYPAGRTAPIVDPGPAALEAKLNPLTYDKGAWVLHMLRRRLGDDAFFRGIRRYYERFAGGSATTEDFRGVMEAAGGGSLARFFHQWLYVPGWPELAVTWRWESGPGEVVVAVEQTQAGPPYETTLEVGLSFGGRREVHRLRLDGRTLEARMPAREAPTALEVDPSGSLLGTFTVRHP
jgi:aminopeptidase N